MADKQKRVGEREMAGERDYNVCVLCVGREKKKKKKKKRRTEAGCCVVSLVKIAKPVVD